MQLNKESELEKNSIDKRLNSINGLKGWLIWFIVLFHSYGADNIVAKFFTENGGVIGNLGFFMASGFLTCYSFERNRKISQGFPKWFGNKLLRIWPAYAFFNMLNLALLILRKGVGSVTISEIFLVLTMQKGGTLTSDPPFVFPGWFVSALFFTFCVFYFVNYLNEHTCIKKTYAYVVLMFLGMILFMRPIDFPFLFLGDGEAFLAFFLGCLMSTKVDLLIKKKWVIYCIALFAIALYSFITMGDKRIVICFIFAPALFILCIDNKLVNSFFSSRISMFLSKISMFVFFTHTLDCFSSIKQNYIVYLLLVFTASSVSYYIDYYIRKIVKNYTRACF